MYLKEINATGFKSFADKLNITLDDNITCIVGPNGSGKSNVVDAVRWVLGEQSVKSLRGDGNMTDVIFSGSKSRNPLNVASVELIFDNSDSYLNIPFSEVSVKRRVYRTGENEYFLNGDKCRLKDITDLFMDSGIGKESFNIISQGEVQKILSNSPYDRRVIFEEAAEVLKYKKRKEEAIRKLDRTNSNLDRVDDIINELSVSIEPLKEQSEKAKIYLDNKKQLENIEVGLLAYEIETINFEYQNTKNKITSLEEEILSLSTSHSGGEAILDTNKMNLLKVEKALNELQSKLLEVTKQEEKINGEKKILKERSKYDARDQKVHDEIASLKENKLRLENEIYILEKEINDDRSNFEEKKKKIFTSEQALTELKVRGNNKEKEYQYKLREKAFEENKISILEQQIANGGNLPSSVKAVINNPRLVGVHNCIGNLIDTDIKFSKALEVILSASRQYIVVDTEIVAKNAINYLKDNHLGRCTFYPLNVIKARYVDNEVMNILRNEPGFIDTFNNLVTYDSEYKNIIANQLGNVIVVTDLDAANRISKKIHERYRIVTLDGDVINVGGSITGGSVNLVKSIITEKYELEKLKRKQEDNLEVIKEIDTVLETIAKEITKMEDILYNDKGNLMALQESLREKVERFNSKREELDGLNSDINSLEHVVDSSLSKEEERIIKEFYDVQKEKNEIEFAIKTSTKERDTLKQTIEELEAKYKLNNSRLHMLEKELKEREISVSKMDVKLDGYLNTLSEDYELTFEKAKENYNLELDVEEARSKVALYKSNIKKIGMVNIASIEEYERVSTRYNFLNGQKEDLLRAKDTLLEIIKEMDSVMEEEFSKTFKLIAKEFEDVFRKLFNGGKATLKLTEPDNLLETGIEIIASPPGKKLTTISLLSGGEKTLTAISLLFAILNVRTVPFCLFDEVEAALDEANVDNFGKYLDHYKSKTQFLLITHKKKTMEYANTLYGITMQESGVSKLVSVKLDSVVR